MTKKIYIASDHAGLELKKILINRIVKSNIDFEDMGPFTYEPVDYPEFAHKVSDCVSKNGGTMGVLICGSGNGVAMTSNKWENIRASLCWSREIASLARSHNDSNVLCIPGRFLSVEDAIDILDYFIHTPFEGGRHENRVKKINKT
jgi:ribose 5-phosphate isomerase B